MRSQSQDHFDVLGSSAVRKNSSRPKRSSVSFSPLRSRRTSHLPSRQAVLLPLKGGSVAFGSGGRSSPDSPRRGGRQSRPRSHDLLNRERKFRGLSRLVRSSALDRIAQELAAVMARDLVVIHSVASVAELHVKLQAKNNVAENGQSGRSVEEMHEAMMAQEGSSSYNNIFGLFEEVGIGKVRGKDGRLYLCQLCRTK